LLIRVAADADAEIRAAGGDLQRRRPQQLLRAGPTALPYTLAVYSFIETRLFYARSTEGQIWLLTIYKKSEESTIPGHVLRQIKEEIDEL
jgi:hypothetical protein